jgi:hypothetical protein
MIEIFYYLISIAGSISLMLERKMMVVAKIVLLKSKYSKLNPSG